MTQIWCDQQKQHIRSQIQMLSPQVRALGNILYLPPGEPSMQDGIMASWLIYSSTWQTLKDTYRNMPEEHKAVIGKLCQSAIAHYWECVSPAIEGGLISSTDLSKGQVKELGNKLEIDTRNWSRDYRPLWRIIIEEIRKADNEALEPLEEWVQEYFDRLKEQREREVG